MYSKLRKSIQTYTSEYCRNQNAQGKRYSAYTSNTFEHHQPQALQRREVRADGAYVLSGTPPNERLVRIEYDNGSFRKHVHFEGEPGGEYQVRVDY